MRNHVHLGNVQHRPLILEKQDQILDWKLDTVCVFTWFDDVVMENVESTTPWGPSILISRLFSSLKWVRLNIESHGASSFFPGKLPFRGYCIPFSDPTLCVLASL